MNRFKQFTPDERAVIMIGIAKIRLPDNDPQKTLVDKLWNEITE